MKKNIVQFCLGLFGAVAIAMMLNAGTIYSDLAPTGSWTLPDGGRL
jgi:hypothetical protein